MRDANFADPSSPREKGSISFALPYIEPGHFHFRLRYLKILRRDRKRCPINVTKTYFVFITIVRASV